MPLLHDLNVMLTQFISQNECLVPLSAARSSRVPLSLQHHQLTSMLGWLGHHTRRCDTQGGDIVPHVSLQHCWQHNSFPPSNVGKLNENHNKNEAVCVCWLEEGRLVEWTTIPHTLSIERAQLMSVKICQTVEICVAMRLNTPRRVHSKAYPKNSSPSKESSHYNFPLCQCWCMQPSEIRIDSHTPSSLLTLKM